MLFLTGLQLKSHFIRLSSLFLLFIPLIVRTEGQQRKEGMDVPLDESWGTWARRHVNHVFTDGPDIVVDEHSYVDDPPDPNEGWKQWAKRQACLKAKIECCIPPYVRRNTFISSKYLKSWVFCISSVFFFVCYLKNWNVMKRMNLPNSL